MSDCPYVSVGAGLFVRSRLVLPCALNPHTHLSPLVFSPARTHARMDAQVLELLESQGKAGMPPGMFALLNQECLRPGNEHCLLSCYSVSPRCSPPTRARRGLN